MTSYVFYPVTGDGQTQATQFVWNTGQINWNTAADWVNGATLVFQDPALAPGAVPGSGTGAGAGASQGPGADSVGLVAGDVVAAALQAYQPNPSKGDPYIGSHVFSVDVLINSGTVDIANLLLGGFNQYAFTEAPQLPTLDVEGATFQVTGSVVNSQLVIFPTITNVPFIGTAGGTLLATGGGTIDIGNGGTVQFGGSVQPNVTVSFMDAKSDLLTLGGVSANAPGAFAGTIQNFAAGDTIFLPALTAPASYTTTFNNGTLAIADGATTLASLPMAGTFTATSFQLVGANGGTDVVLSTGTTTGGAGLLGSLNTDQQLELTYIAYFNRGADGGGKDFWGGQNVKAQAAGQPASTALTNIANAFAPQPETEGLYPSLIPYLGSNPPPLNTTAGQVAINSFLDAVYTNLFARAADTDGKSYWAGQITTGQVGLGAAALAIANGAIGGDAIEVRNKITVALDFTTRTNSVGLGTTPSLPASFIAAAKGALSGVDATSLNDASVTAGMAVTSAYIAVTPVITSVSWNTATQSVQILGSGFGAQSAYNGDSQFIELYQPATQFSAGYTGPDVQDTSTLNVTNWTGNEIDIHGFTGTYGGPGLAFVPGDPVIVSVANPTQTAPLFTTFPASFTLTVPSASAQLAAGPEVVTTADSSVISITDPNQVLDFGAGGHVIQFLTGASAETLVLHADGVDQVSGFDPGSDKLDLGSLLRAANIDPHGSLAGYLTVVDQGADAVLRFDPSGAGGGSAVAVLQGLGDSITGLGTLLAKGAISLG